MGAVEAAEYEARVNRAIDFIEANLERKPTLDEVARAAGLSSFHFHRIFSAHMGETIGQFATRLRLERAAARLLDRPQEPITDIALDLGFSSSASFARAFGAHFGTPASRWRKGHRGRRSNARSPSRPTTSPDPPEVRIEDWSARHVAYVRHRGPYAGDPELFQRLIARLMRWAKPRGLAAGADLVGLYHDSPGVTDESRLRLSVGLALERPPRELGPGIQRLEIPAGRWAVSSFRLAPTEYEAAWARVYAGWLPSSRYQPAHRPALERYGAPDGSDRLPVDICIPIEPLV